MITGFQQKFHDVNGVRLSVHTAGQGEPLLLLHGYPQTHMTWSKVAPEFAKSFSCVAPDLRGYGDSSVPKTDDGHLAYSKREMGRDMIALMAELGHQTFMVLGHDRGARVAYRMTLDHPDHVKKVGIVEVVPTSDMWDRFNAKMALKAYHWTFLAQPHPLPENMIGGDPVAYLEWTLKSWVGDGTLDAFSPEAMESYKQQFLNPDHVHGMCQDYRAGATIDRELDEESRANGDKIKVPLCFTWAENSFPAQTVDPLGLWQEWADNVEGHVLPGKSGHFPMEENPQAIVDCFVPFFLK
ncbi:alpha/beta hydrolase [Terasakiella sp. A23]|uniref:alpha/beta fold hydrolase n=1 Tax=Terasakiella sp. FCG-A23 TaxID=3080561 RepID=UPI00295479D8|nr:alpha/beta hydrolase [Terasakiella sp. A23]MDV7341658.1 alpha/beta hydrolase [Terasakiella sp. A23]